MDILKLIAANLDDILVLIFLIVVGVVSGIKVIKNHIAKMKTMPTEERIAYIKRLLENLYPAALSMVTNAEKKYGSKTGLLKKSYVYEKLYTLIPDEYKPYITETNLESILETALETAQIYWKNNPSMQNVINQNETININQPIGPMDVSKLYSAISVEEQRIKRRGVNAL